MDWFRWWHGSSTDPKFQMIAKECDIPLASILGIWAYVLEKASHGKNRGSFIPDFEEMEFHLGINCVTPCNAMKHRGMLHETDGVFHIVKWEERQPKREREDNSSDRVKAYRERKKENVTPCNANETRVTPREDKRRDINTCINFLEFWKAYPRKVSKPDAEKAWIKHSCETSFEEIIAGLTAWKNTPDWMADNGKYIPYPASWLNRRGWEDEITPVMQKKWGGLVL